MKIAFIVNPKSGKAGKNNEILKIVREFTRGRGLDANIFVTKHKGHPNRLAEDAKLAGFKRIIVVGGDGTINEVANAIVGSEIEIGIVPCGSGNGLARHLNIPLDVDRALNIATGCSIEHIDCGKVGDRCFFNVMGIGIDAAICRSFENSNRGLFSYIKAGLVTFNRYKTNIYKIVVDGKSTRNELCMIAIANSSQYGNSAYIAPSASVRDGIFRMVYLNKPSWLRLLLLAYRLFFQTIERANFVTSLDAKSILVSSNDSFLFHLDGEIQPATTHLEISLIPSCLRVVSNGESFV